MHEMYDRFSAEAKEIMGVSYAEAEEWKHDYVGTEHLLLALLKVRGTTVYRFLEEQSVTYAKVYAETERVVGKGERRFPTDDLKPTPQLKRIIILAHNAAQQYGHHLIGPEHLLLGLMEEGNSDVVRILNHLGVDRSKLGQLLSSTQQSKGTSGRRLHRWGSGEERKGGKSFEFGRNLVEEARAGRLDPVLGREKEIEQVIQTLSRRKKNNPVLIGEPGVGKTAIVEGLAQRIASNEVPSVLMDKEILELDMASMVAGTKYRGEFEQRLKNLINQVESSKNIILFIDELHTVVGAGGAEGAIDASAILKPPLASGMIQCLGTATLDEYRKYIEKDSALERRFKKIVTAEPSIDDAIEILKGLRPRYESHHGVKISDDAVVQAVKLSDRYINDHFLPDKAIDLIDETSAKIKLASTAPTPEIRQQEEQLAGLEQEKTLTIANQDYERAAEIRDEIREMEVLLQQLHDECEDCESFVTGNDIAKMVSTWTGVPLGHMREEESQRMVHMEDVLHEDYINQNEAVKAISQSIRRAYAGVKNPKRPIASFLFLGPTGVGKTYLSKVLANFLFGNEDSLIRIDMSEYMERFSVSRLIGAPPGYVGYDEAGELTEAVRRRPYAVVLFDEIEKAHRDVFNILLQVMDDGILTDAQGRHVDFRNTVLIMTSNLGSKAITDRTSLGFSASDLDAVESYKEMQGRVMGEVRELFRPEFINRLDDNIVFRQLEEKDIGKIADLMINELKDRLADRDIFIELTSGAKNLLVQEGYDPKFGARPMRRTIERLVENPISDKLLEGKFVAGDIIEVGMKGDEINFKKKNKTLVKQEQ